MNTTTISEADVVGFIRKTHAALCLPDWARLGVSATHNDSALFSIYGSPPKGEWIHANGDTADQAAAEFAAKLPPTGAALAAKKRADAAKLLAEADAIAPEPIAKPAAVELDPCEDAA